MALIRQIEVEGEELKAQVAMRSTELSEHEENIRKCEAALERKETELMQWERFLDSREKERATCEHEKIQERQTVIELRETELRQWERSLGSREEEIMTKEIQANNAAVDLHKHEIGLNNLKEKLRKEELSIAKSKEELMIEKGELDAAASEIEKEKERLEDLEIDIEDMKKEARQIRDSSHKTPDRLPFNPNNFIVNDPTEQLAALEKQLHEQELYFITREGEFQDARVGNKRYRMREEELKSMEEELQKKEKGLQEMEVQIQLKDACIESTMAEVEGIRDMLKKDSRCTTTTKRNRSTQATQVRMDGFLMNTFPFLNN
jgi:chromosome segregation ATPase